ncbi:MAG TPA: MlaD family protein [Thermoleophilaceae bacterium]|nr:MlaD family protein [Thermoleophilaceae bacterium]
MKRIAAVLLLGVVAAVATLGAGGTAPTYRVDAVFDSTANLIPGQDVKIAGARVGSVSDINLTAERKARVEMEVEEGFAPFRADAECTIRPQSLIGEKFVQCHPGTPDAAPLAEGEDGAPTVPLANTHSPVDLDLVFAALREPYAERLAIILNELGTGVAGRAEDVNAAVRRANPALQELNDVLRILDRDRAALGRLVDQSDRVIAELARHREHVTSFIERADRAAAEVAGRRGELGEVIERLPPLLDELEPTADRLAALASDATPTLRDLRAAAPGAERLLADFDPVADAARPALNRLAETSEVGRRAVAAARPVADRLRPVAAILPPMARLGARLGESLQENGSVENLLLFFFYGAGAQARFDQFSHMLPSYQIAGECQQYARTLKPPCSAHFGDPPAAPAGQARALDYLLGE